MSWTRMQALSALATHKIMIAGHGNKAFQNLRQHGLATRECRTGPNSYIYRITKEGLEFYADYQRYAGQS